MATLDFPLTDGFNNQRKEFLYRQIIKYRPDLADSPDVIYGDLELLYIRFLNDGTIPDASENVGPTGAPGIQGPTGPQGSQGEKGDKGDKGDTGNTGNTGAQGLTGLTGPQGIQGPKGDKGDTGLQGSAGIQGPTGNTGAQGLTGPQGLPGAKGDAGIQGIQGPKGDIGLTGNTGPQGAQGVQGVKGDTGNTGPQGIQGIKGDTGNTGAQGPQGIQGLKGADGTSVTIKGSVATVANLPTSGNINGDGWITSNDGHLHVWNGTVFEDVGLVKGPKGDTGATGAAGPQGIQGIKGDTGNTGPTGNTGLTGPQGAQGIQGPAGLKGDTGLTGATGAAGPQGIQGIKGDTGAQGIQGISGVDGDTGPTGPQGIQGPIGNTGPQGIQGTKGDTGNTGPQGIQGIQGIQGDKGDKGDGFNLLGDGGFELGTSSVLTVYSGTSNHRVDGTKSRSGTGYLELTANSTTNDCSVLFNDIPVHEGRTYRMSAWVKTGVGTDGNSRWTGTMKKSDGTDIFITAQGSYPLNNSTYIEIFGTYTIPSGLGYGSFRPRLTMNNNRVPGNSILIDDCYIVDITEVVRVARSTETLATSSLNGHMVATDKAKLDSLPQGTSGATASTTMIRDGNGTSSAYELLLTRTPQSADARGATRKDYVDQLISKGYKQYVASDPLTSYSIGITQFLGECLGTGLWDVWPGQGQSFASIVTIRDKGYTGGSVQYAYPYSKDNLPVAYRMWETGDTVWGAWQYLTTQAYLPINVKSYGAKGDGTTDDTTVINMAIAAAQGRELYFPKGQYKVSANLVNFWGCFARGEGSLLRGSEEYFITPSSSPTLITTSTLWSNYGTGIDTNDGLFSVTPIKTSDRVYKCLRTLSSKQANGGPWRVRMSGTYIGGQKYELLQEFLHGLTFEGDALVGGVPVTTVNYTGTGTFIGMWFEPGVRQVKIKNLKFTNFVVGYNGYAVIMKDGGNLEIDDCVADTCDTGFAAINNVNFHIDNTRATNCTTGFSAAYSSSGTFDHCTADNNTAEGFVITRNAVVHIDYCTIDNNHRGVLLDMAARANLMQNDIRRNTLGVRAEGASEWIDASNIWNNSTATVTDPLANDINFQSFGAGRETRQYSITSHNEWLVSNAWDANATYLNPVTITGTTANSVVYLGSGLGSLPAQWFTHPGKAVRVKVYGKATTTAVGRVRLYITETNGTGATVLSEIDVSAGLTNISFEVEFKVWSKAIASQLARATITGSGVARASSATPVVNMATEKLFRLYYLPGATGDSFTADNMEIYFYG